ncbi:negative transcriptional regulator [Shewanella denitrificans OS217]|jgi:transcriptional regulator|uniref:Negative transcriptional regulator n=1 Tax=Shewanella denitrificans (strain OS217 / ATCC BAA-1090 / DSM 15013) TaxID=318161 RepID=Q12HR1_SHEDO|nr:FMN-binding negative transcriptional regulator [Shewanella denitrificans]ABE57015.1 negative transcriptional regulator [Shewanella denitrificans OS217]
MYTYVPKSFSTECSETLRNLVLQNSFATLITVDNDGELHLSHLPVILEQSDHQWRFSFHLAVSNRHSQVLADSAKSVLIFKGPHAYISPTWYQKQSGVPTWNYAIAHFEGRVRPLDAGDLLGHLRQQVHLYEPQLNGSEVMPDELVDRLSGMISGFELTADQVLSKFKLGQNRSAEDQAGIFEALRNSDKPQARALAKLME